MNKDLDLTLQRVIKAPRDVIWNAWTDPSLLARWWVPAPSTGLVDQLEVWPGGGFVTRSSDDGRDPVPHMDATFLAVDKLSRLVFTNAITSDWRPATPPVAMTAEIELHDHPDGTDYRVTVRHGDPSVRARHQEIGFFKGWGEVTEALAVLAEREAVAR